MSITDTLNRVEDLNKKHNKLIKTSFFNKFLQGKENNFKSTYDEVAASHIRQEYELKQKMGETIADGISQRQAYINEHKEAVHMYNFYANVLEPKMKQSVENANKKNSRYDVEEQQSKYEEIQSTTQEYKEQKENIECSQQQQSVRLKTTAQNYQRQVDSIFKR